jgi:DeoR/GlpR family transcriptional regulator of sugar metabolism
LSQRQAILYQLLQERSQITKKEAALALNTSDDTAIRELNALVKLGVIKKIGKGKAVRYHHVK